MNAEVNSENKEFWERTAEQYDTRMHKAKFYDEMIRRIAEDVASAERVLDVATGTGVAALEIAGRSKSVDAFDSSRNMIDIARDKAQKRNVENVTFSIQSVYDLNYPDDAFDAVVACNALHLMQRQELALEEIKRVLKPSGLLVACTYCHGQTLVSHIASRLMSLKGFRVFRRFTYASYVLLIKAAGFKVEKLDIWPGIIPMACVKARADKKE
jgi:phosphatidylethanolamine/phosphatidyl-N-methylethanolamine N-methyltransferase